MSDPSISMSDNEYFARLDATNTGPVDEDDPELNR
jgi:hypothetical protein